uniref:Uncharacterized protein n=1 Tax=Auxenochlorella protothecoides TaxID=3075 RepID=A0A1D1ZU16_AUXPR
MARAWPACPVSRKIGLRAQASAQTRSTCSMASDDAQAHAAHALLKSFTLQRSTMHPTAQARFQAAAGTRAPWRSAVSAMATNDPLSPAPILLFLDDLDVLAGHQVFQQVVRDTCSAMRQCSGAVVALAIDGPAAELASACSSAPALTLLDCHSDAHGCWARAGVQSSPHAIPGTLAAPPGLWAGRVASAVAAGPAPAACVVDGLDGWVGAHGVRAVLSLLADLARSPGVVGLLARLRPGAHEERACALLRRAVHAEVALLPPPPGAGPEALCVALCARPRARAGPRVEAVAVSRAGQVGKQGKPGQGGASLMYAPVTTATAPGPRVGAEAGGQGSRGEWERVGAAAACAIVPGGPKAGSCSPATDAHEEVRAAVPSTRGWDCCSPVHAVPRQAVRHPARRSPSPSRQWWLTAPPLPSRPAQAPACEQGWRPGRPLPQAQGWRGG